jgi:transposase
VGVVHGSAPFVDERYGVLEERLSVLLGKIKSPRGTYALGAQHDGKAPSGPFLLPPYSPDFFPIEECWSNIKTIVRTKAARTLERLWQAITEALAAITSQDAQGW